MSRLIPAVGCWVMLLFFARPLAAGTLEGSIVDAEDGRPVPYSTVVISGTTAAGQSLERGALSTDSGAFRLKAIPAGAYFLRVGHIGYTDYTDSVRIDSGQTARVDVQLVPAPIQMEGLIVEGVRPEEERKVQPGIVTLDAQTLADVPSVGEADPIRTVQLLPGVQAASDISSGLYIRGGGPDQTLVLLDNVTVYNPTHAFGFFSTFNPDMLGGVTLYKGAYPASQGGRLGAVLDVRTRESTAPMVTGTGGVSTIASRLTFEGPLGSHNWMVSARRTYLDPVLSLLRKSSSDIPSYYFYDLNARLNLNHSDARTVITSYSGRDDIFFDLDRSTFIDIRWGNDLVSATHRRILNRQWSASLGAGLSEYSSETELRLLNTPFRVTNRLRELFVRSDFNWHPGDRLRSLFGWTFSSYDFLYRQSFNEVESIDFERRPWEWSGYIDQEWDPNERTSLRLGVRGRYLSDGRRVLAEPRLAASRKTGNWLFKLGAGIYNQYLQLITTEAFSAGDFYFPIDETVSPGRSWQTVLGGEWEATPKYRLGIEAYYTGLENLVVLDNTAPVDPSSIKARDIFFTDGRGYATGIELFAERRQGSVTGWIGYTLGTTRRTFDELNGGRAFPPKYDRRHDLNLVASYRRGPWKYGCAFLYATGQAFTPASARYNLRDPATGAERDGSLVLPGARNSARLLPYHRLDVSVHKRCRVFGQQAQWYVQVSNLYNRRNEWFVDYGKEVEDVKVVKMLPVIPSLGIDFEF